MRDSGDRDHTLNVRVDADETGISGKELEYVHENPEGFGASVAVGESGDKFYGRVGVTKETEDGDQQYFGVGVNEDGEVEAEGRITHNVSDDVDVHAGVRKSRSGGATVSAGLNADVGEDKDFDLNMGITANTKGDKLAPMWVCDDELRPSGRASVRERVFQPTKENRFILRRRPVNKESFRHGRPGRQNWSRHRNRTF